MSTDSERAKSIRAAIVARAAAEDEVAAARARAISNHPQPTTAGDHGLLDIERRGVHALTLRQLEAMTGTAHDLETRQGIKNAVRRQAALSLTVIDHLVGYLERRAAEGTDIGDLPVTRMLPSFQNSAQRLLQALEAMTPKESTHSAEVKRVQGVVISLPGAQDSPGQAAADIPAPEDDDG